jgi:uncharacterized protein YecE (DUF72 family)
MIRVGCSGWNYAHWRNGVFYPPRCPTRDWLTYYAATFSTVEVNSTFYRLPRRAAVQRWVEQTPASFIFAVKTSRYLTHIKRLRELPAHLEKLLDCLEPLWDASRLGPLLWQLPPTFQRDDERLATALSQLPTELRHAFEFRHPSWFCEPVYDLLREHGAARVIADRPEIHTHQAREMTADFTYLRFHSGSPKHGGSYTPTQLRRWATAIRAWSVEGDVYAYFNNDWEGYAINNAQTLQRRLDA